MRKQKYMETLFTRHAGAYAKASFFIFVILWFSIICAAGSFMFRSAGMYHAGAVAQ